MILSHEWSIAAEFVENCQVKCSAYTFFSTWPLHFHTWLWKIHEFSNRKKWVNPQIDLNILIQCIQVSFVLGEFVVFSLYKWRMCLVCLIEVVIFRFGRLFKLDETSSVMSAGDVMMALVTPWHKTYSTTVVCLQLIMSQKCVMCLLVIPVFLLQF